MSDQRWRRGFEEITSNISVDATDIDEDNDEPERCTCQAPYKKGPCCFDERCVNYATQTECTVCHPGCQNQRFRRRQFANIEVREAPGKGFGLFTNEDLKPGQFVYEYYGELISLKELNRRMNESVSERHLYAMQLNSRTFLDSRKKGSIGRFINHSCEPNCQIEVWNSCGRLHVGIFTTASIAASEELTFDYQVHTDTDIDTCTVQLPPNHPYLSCDK
jgi:[histone H3]-lysine36 N-trimethyltransferase